MEPKQFTTRSNYSAILGVAVLLVAVVAILVYFLFFKIEPKKEVDKLTKDNYKYIKDSGMLASVNNLVKAGDYETAYKEIDSLIDRERARETDPGVPNPRETLELYKISLKLEQDREAAFKDYYNFFQNKNNSPINRGYALVKAQLDVIANNDAKKSLFVLDEDVVRNMKSLENKDIIYQVSKKIYSVFPFPLAVTRIVSYELESLDKNDPEVKTKAQKIVDQYMTGFDDYIQVMLGSEGLRHIVANSLAGKGRVYTILEDIELVDTKETTFIYAESVKYANLYSPGGTQDFLLLGFLNHEVKIKNEDNVEKIVNMFKDIKERRSIDSEVLKNLSDEARMKENYPFIYNRYVSDPSFKEVIKSI